mmetsp:Transcript_9295/g.8136  ORF Transcript_9295/g.8136 Transcript_9295/m.8136 type:complete len:90 (+) Transcript_9295:67-336(+)
MENQENFFLTNTYPNRDPASDFSEIILDSHNWISQMLDLNYTQWNEAEFYSPENFEKFYKEQREFEDRITLFKELYEISLDNQTSLNKY